MPTIQRDVLVVGAGITGLTLGYRLAQHGADVLVCERAARSGGQLYTLEDAGRIIDIGAEGFVARSQAVPQLCRDVGLEQALTDQNTTDTFVAEGGQLTLLPPGEAAARLGFQVSREHLGRGIRSLRRGMGQLSDALADSLGKNLRLGSEVRSCGAAETRALEVSLTEGTSVSCRQLVVATAARQAAVLLQDLAPEAAELEHASLLSSLSVILAYDAAHIADRPHGGGFIVPPDAQRFGFRACSFVDHKFDGRAPRGSALLRAFFRPREEELRDVPDDEWVTRAIACVGQALRVAGPPQAQWVARWPDALPVHDAEHGARVARVTKALPPTVHLAGSAFHGAGLDAAVVSAEQTARAVLDALSVRS